MWVDYERAMTTAGPGIFYDGTTSARHSVRVELAPAMLQIRAADGRLLAGWAYNEIEKLSAPDHVLRIGLLGSPILARLEIRDPALATAIDDLSLTIDRSGASERRMQRKVVFWSIAASISLVLVAVFGVPEIATRLAPLVPYRIETLLGDAVDAQIRAMLDSRKLGNDFECGNSDGAKAGKAAFDHMLTRLEQAAALPVPLNAKVVRRSEANAIALPGGRIYIFEGLINKAESADEVAGVLAHEIGHVARRDGMRSVMQAAGLSFLFGMLLGDFVGGGAVVVAARTVLQLSYSRDVEAAADGYSVGLMQRVNANPHGLATILKRIAGSGNTEGWVKILLDHPETRDRVAIIEATSAAGAQPILDASEWTAFRRICARD
jgi:Zn-dependent protease with chaperone function